jgi:hypothetical protein
MPALLGACGCVITVSARGKSSRARVILYAAAGQASSLRIVTPPSSSPTTLKPCRS